MGGDDWDDDDWPMTWDTVRVWESKSCVLTRQ
jgi:hypothetical protein